MPRHQQATSVVETAVPMCSTCGAREGGLTTDCPGTKIDYDKQLEIYETNLDYTDDRGWHLGESAKSRAPRFANTRVPPTPPSVDPREVVAPSVDWTLVDRAASLQHELSRRAIAWALSDRDCEEAAALCARLKDEVDKTSIGPKLKTGTRLNQADNELLVRLERAKIDFHLACDRAEKCDEEFKQLARRLVAELEARPLPAAANQAGVP